MMSAFFMTITELSNQTLYLGQFYCFFSDQILFLSVLKGKITAVIIIRRSIKLGLVL